MREEDRGEEGDRMTGEDEKGRHDNFCYRDSRAEGH